MKKLQPVLILVLLFILSCSGDNNTELINISGVYPHLAYYNNEGECGTGAVVPWAGSLWVISYGPHCPQGSSDKLYQLSPELEMIIREESIGGTPANRMIHRESSQLFIGPYVIDSSGNVRVIPYSVMFGRLTGNARHLYDPENKIYCASMEEGFYEIDVQNLEVNTLYKDGYFLQKKGDMSQEGPLLPGAHGKGLYSGQGVLVFSNNGESTPEALEKFDIEAGALAEWDGENWKVVRRNQFVEVTGPGGIYGNTDPDNDPVWATGWDQKSIIIGCRDAGSWSFYRLPKASHSYDGAHGWNTEWPRIRDIGTEGKSEYLMTMHGQFWHFPESFGHSTTAGIRPGSAYLKVIGDFTRWNNRLVFGCDDSALKEFLNTRKVKAGIPGPGQSNSNLWFTNPETPFRLGPSTASGSLWLNDSLQAGDISEPFLFSGWTYRSAWIQNHSEHPVTVVFEADSTGNSDFDEIMEVELEALSSQRIEFSNYGEWVRARSLDNAVISLHFNYSDRDERKTEADNIFMGLLKADQNNISGGLLYATGNNRRTLGLLASVNGEKKGYYELNEKMELKLVSDSATETFMETRLKIPGPAISIDDASVLVIDDKNRRWRLPLGSKVFTELTLSSEIRICREVATERDLFNCHGTFYELPAENADGFAKIRPVASHNYRINDYTSYRGMLIMTGIDPKYAKRNPRIFVSDDGKAAVWAGVIDDLWKMGKPTGRGGPWFNSEVSAGVPSDPYLMAFYDEKELTISHDAEEEVNFIIEVEAVGHGSWMKYMEITVPPGEEYKYKFPEGFFARWIRIKASSDCKASCILNYR